MAVKSDDVRNAQFQMVRWPREGYDITQVDQFLTELAEALARLERRARPGPADLTDESVILKKFSPTKYRRGYKQEEVDDFLDAAASTLRSLGASRPDPS
jgi:DivIVA domain-containing protein